MPASVDRGEDDRPREGTMRTKRSIASGTRTRGAILGALVLAVVAAGGARTSVQGVEVQPAQAIRPTLIVVHQFSVSPSEVVLDSSVGSRIEEAMSGTPEATEQLKVAREVTQMLAKSLVEEIAKVGIPTEL